MMLRLKRDIADFKRFKEIIQVLFEEGFHILLENAKLSKFVPIKKKIARKKQKIPPEVRLRKTLERLGPTFVKLGQILSVRPDLVPKNYMQELENLQDNVEPFSYAEAKRTIEKGTGKKLEQIFSKFSKKPEASASIAQVHKAYLKTGEKVAVKVRRPGIVETVKKDIEIMHFIASLIEKHISAVAKYHPKAIVEEFSEWTQKEIYLRVETENIQRFYDNFRKSRTTKIPKVYEKYCNEDIIVMEFLEGVELHKLKGKKSEDIDIRKTLQNGFYSILEQVFIHGLFHADPHASNIFALKSNKVGFVDFGIVGYFDDYMKDMVTDIFIGIMEGNSENVVEKLLDLGNTEEIDMLAFRKNVNEVIFPLQKGRLKDIKISSVMEEVLDIAFRFGIKIPREFVLFGKSIVTIEGIGLMYYPDFRLHEMAQPFLEKIIAERYQPKNVLKKGILGLFGAKKTMGKIPSRLARVLEKLEKGKIKIEMRDTDIQKLSLELDKSSNRLTYGMIIAALLISGSLTINVGEEIFLGLPLISALSFSAAAFLVILLFISIIKERWSK
ncbi:hypothetical protein GF323_06680 [Candidatus Woesearchaeota archaeon]|nr:hypothetical protein [Candidatus Woesearchaeota archaeon]